MPHPKPNPKSIKLKSPTEHVPTFHPKAEEPVGQVYSSLGTEIHLYPQKTPKFR